MATKADIDSALEDLVAKVGRAEGSARDSLDDTDRTLSLRIPDLESDYWTRLRQGRMEQLRHGVAEDADIRIRVGSDDLLALLGGRLNLTYAFLTGKIRVDASPADLLRIRSLLG